MEANRSRDVWGQLGRTPSPIRYGYKAQSGYYTDVESGILFLTHRYLDPATGRFLTRDPIGVKGGVNLYAYCRNRVVTQSDYLGTQSNILLPPFELIGWLWKLLQHVGGECARCATESLKLARRVLEWSSNDLLAHCYATCEITRCSCSPVCVGLAGGVS